MDIEQEIQAKGLTAPRITPADIEANIASEHYFTADQGATQEAYETATINAAISGTGIFHQDAIPPVLGLLTFCVLVLRNGFTVTGQSACASPENFDAEIAREDAVRQVWPLLGYELRSKLATA